tara:strand:+ start:1321 stop:1680 length:360 start_codon:yes stop_codon:yes gene_type:complete
MSRRGNCHDNAVAESFFNLFKHERIRRRVYKSSDEARQDVFDYIEMFCPPKRHVPLLGRWRVNAVPPMAQALPMRVSIFRHRPSWMRSGFCAVTPLMLFLTKASPSGRRSVVTLDVGTP